MKKIYLPFMSSAKKKTLATLNAAKNIQNWYHINEAKIALGFEPRLNNQVSEL
jgi:hypothetical protein